MEPFYCTPDMTMYVGDVLDVLREMPADSVHTCVTSPPYWGLRDYGVDGQIGLEGTPEEYVARMVEVFHEVGRVLHSTGTLWCNIGDSYATGAGKVGDCPGGGEQGERWKGYRGTRSESLKHAPGAMGPMIQPNRMPIAGLKPKDLVGIPWRLAFALQADGWWLRSDIIWHKPNPMPESVTDRPTKAHEYVFLLSKQPRYYYDGDAIREPNLPQSEQRAAYPGRGHPRGWHTDAVPISGGDQVELSPLNSAGRNARSVWSIATEPYADAHFATFPTSLVKPCILAGTSEHGVCGACGAPWRRVMERQHYGDARQSARTLDAIEGRRAYRRASHGGKDDLCDYHPPVTTGWEPTCTCNADVAPATVLDCFGGSGTTSLVARQLGRKSVYIDLNEEYARLAIKRLEGQAWAML